MTGWGDICPMPGWSVVTVHEALGALGSLVGEVSSAVVSEALTALVPVAEIRAGLAGAWLDLESQRHHCSLASYLGSNQDATATSLAVHATITPREVAAAVRAAVDAVESGFSAVKCKVGHRTTEDEVALVTQLRATLGPSIEIRLDANGGWDVEQAHRVLEQVAEFDVSFCEEPVAGLEQLIAFAERSPVRVAIDESAATGDDIAAAVDGGVGVVVMKPQALGGADRAVSLAADARRRGAQVVITSMIESAVGVAHAANVAAAVAPETVHGLATSTLLADDIATALSVVDGRIQIGSPFGLGVGLPSSS